jgi:hypothetical protein
LKGIRYYNHAEQNSVLLAQCRILFGQASYNCLQNWMDTSWSKLTFKRKSGIKKLKFTAVTLTKTLFIS